MKEGKNYYLNTGLLPFLHNDLIVNLDAGRLTLVPQPPAVAVP